MTKRDFETIAAVLADQETRIEHRFVQLKDAQVRDAELGVLDSTISDFATRLKKSHPRFAEGTFRVACRPIQAAEARARVKASLAANPNENLPEWMHGRFGL